jgi:hypothetical protein
MNAGTLHATVEQAGNWGSDGEADGFVAAAAAAAAGCEANNMLLRSNEQQRSSEETSAVIDNETCTNINRVSSPMTNSSRSTSTFPLVSKAYGHLRASWNRVRVAEPQLRYDNMPRRRGRLDVPSRVLHVRGPAADVNPDSLEVFFSSNFRYHIDRVVCHGIDDEGQAEYEYRFACWKNQVGAGRN